MTSTNEDELPPVPEKIRQKSAPELPEPYEYHLYISYNEIDRDIIRKLEQQLESQNYKLFRLMGNHSHFTDEIDKCWKVVAFITPNYLADNILENDVTNYIEMSTYSQKRQYFSILHDIDATLVPSFIKEVNYLKTTEPNFWQRLNIALTEDVKLPKNIPIENIADGLAWSYYYGYLALVLPGIQERLQDFDYPDKSIPFLNKFIILMPESGFCAQSIGNVDKNFRFIKYAKHEVTRSGVFKRDYGNTIWRMTDPETDKDYYVAMEYATPLWTMYEMEMGRLARLGPSAKTSEIQAFISKLEEILKHEQCHHCQGKYLIVRYKDCSADGSQQMQYDSHALSRLIGQHVRRELNI